MGAREGQGAVNWRLVFNTIPHILAIKKHDCVVEFPGGRDVLEKADLILIPRQIAEEIPLALDQVYCLLDKNYFQGKCRIAANDAMMAPIDESDGPGTLRQVCSLLNQR